MCLLGMSWSYPPEGDVHVHEVLGDAGGGHSSGSYLKNHYHMIQPRDIQRAIDKARHEHKAPITSGDRTAFVVRFHEPQFEEVIGGSDWYGVNYLPHDTPIGYSYTSSDGKIQVRVVATVAGE